MTFAMMLPTEQFVDHLNAGQLDEALALMTDDAFFPPDNVGKDAIREELEQRKADNTQVTVINPRVVGDAVESEWTITSDCIRESGLGSFGGTTTIEFVDGKISADLPVLDLTDEQFVQLAEATVCTAALGQTLPAAGSGGLTTGTGGPAPLFYALAVAGALLTLGGLAVRRTLH